MEIASKIAAVAMAVGCMAGLAAAQEPTKEETIAWLQEKIEQGSLGCETRYHRISKSTGIVTRDKYIFSQALTRDRSTFVLISDSINDWVETASSGRVKETRSQSKTRYSFNPSAIDADAIEVVEANTLSIERDLSNQVTDTDITHSCHEIRLPLSQPALANYSNGKKQQIKSLTIYLADLSLATRMKSAFEHWVKLEQSGAGEPF